MADWREELMKALHSGDAEYMTAMLGQVPPELVEHAVSTIASMASACLARGDHDQALIFLDQLVAAKPLDSHWYRERSRTQMRRGAFAAALHDAEKAIEIEPGEASGYVLQGDAHLAEERREQALAAYVRALELEPSDEILQKKVANLSGDAQDQIGSLPRIRFDPAVFRDPTMPESVSIAMIEGLTRHLSRYGYHQAVRNTLDRLLDPNWVEAWRTSLTQCAGSTVVFCGGELGFLPLIALELGAEKVIIVSGNPLEQRIASGIIQKHRLLQWRDTVADRFESMSPEEKRSSFETFNQGIVFADKEKLGDIACDWLVFSDIDHSLLATGLVTTLEDCRQRGLVPARGVLPQRAMVHAIGIQWLYPGSDFDFSPVQAMRWSLHPEALDLPSSAWVPVTASVSVCTIDFLDFRPGHLQHTLPVTADGHLDAILFWYELDLGNTRIGSGIGQGLECLRPAVQYVDPSVVRRDERIVLHAHLEATRLLFELDVPRAAIRDSRLPSWYVPMMLDRHRNDAYRKALGTLGGDCLALEIGAGCGLLSMLAVDAGAGDVYGCEVEPLIFKTGERVVSLNGYAHKIHLVNKDCRRLALGEDLPQRADLVLFELFDCGLIGEGILHFLDHVRQQLAMPEARYLPMAARVRGMIVESRIDSIAGIDANLLNPFLFTPSYMNVDASRLRYLQLSEPFDVFAFDFASATPEPQETKIVLDAIAAGTAGAVLFWFDLQLDEDTWLSNAPDSGVSFHWHQAMQYLPEARVEPGMRLGLTAKHQGSGIAFAWTEGDIPQSAFSRLPRVDPTSWAQAMELEAQTQQLLSHARSSPEEHARVAEVAIRIAVDPGRFRIDPKVAQRFASLFL